MPPIQGLDFKQERTYVIPEADKLVRSQGRGSDAWMLYGER